MPFVEKVAFGPERAWIHFPTPTPPRQFASAAGSGRWCMEPRRGPPLQPHTRTPLPKVAQTATLSAQFLLMEGGVGWPRIMTRICPRIQGGLSMPTGAGGCSGLGHPHAHLGAAPAPIWKSSQSFCINGLFRFSQIIC